MLTIFIFDYNPTTTYSKHQKEQDHEKNDKKEVVGYGDVGSFSRGMNNNTTLFGGALAAADYQNVSVGIGRDIAPFRGFAVKASYSRAQLDNLTGK